LSRSRRKTPISGITTARSEKEFKKISNHKFRARERTLVKKVLDEEIVMPERTRDVVETYAGPKDGKMYFGDSDDKLMIMKLMRK
jgi:hypothetical protein